MAKLEPTYELKNAEDLSAFLLGAVRDVRKNELDLDKAEVLSKLADKYTKNELMIYITGKKAKANKSFDLNGEVNKQLISKASGEE
jgi:hypothetical protein